MLAPTPRKKESDGRRQRSEASRERIVKAMLELIGEGNVSPSAEDVAVCGKVGLRTVFRHFDNMESLYRQINALMAAEIRPLLERQLTSKGWKERLAELIEKRSQLFERIMPFKIAADI